jgi:diguanylate cyclase
VIDIADWKTKYLDALRQSEVDERRWKNEEAMLRRLINRLCAAAIGIDERLDVQLTKIADANRRNADVAELAARQDSLADTLKMLERTPTGRSPIDLTLTGSFNVGRPAAVAPPPAPTAAASAPPRAAAVTPAQLNAVRAATNRVIGELAVSGTPEPQLASIRAAVAAANSDAALAASLSAVADAVAERAREVAAERVAAAAVLRQVTERLEEMAEYIGSLGGERQARLDAAAALSIGVQSQFRSLSKDLASAADLAALRALVAERLEGVARQVREFHDRESERAGDAAARVERMRERIGELERETRDLSRNLEQERRRSRIDPLTRIANNGAFAERLAEELARWRRFGTAVSLLLWDIDRFKLINDTYGHRVGDAVLREVAACLAGRVRTTDLVARYGGEEFAMLLVGSTTAQAIALAEELRTAVGALGFHFKGTPVVVTLSCGITELREGDTADSAFDRADKALYRAKDGGRNRHEVG